MRSFIQLVFLVALALLIQHRPALAAEEPPQLTEEPQVLDEDGIIKFHVAGRFRASPAAAKEDALQAAQQQMRWWLARQESPIRHVPTIDTIRRKLITQEELPIEQIDNGQKTYKITISVFLNQNIIRELRATDRVVTSTWWLGTAMGILALVAIVFRLDEWTKGYLTRWLVVGAAGIGLAVGLFLWWVK
jgi:hypothetical protein